jgi:hypothetical protein
VLAEEVAGQDRDVLDALAQRRQRQVDDVDAVVQVLAELAGRDHAARSRLVAAMMRTSTLRVSVSPTRLNVPSCRTRSSLDLQRRRHVADLVEEERAGVGDLEQPGLVA